MVPETQILNKKLRFFENEEVPHFFYVNVTKIPYFVFVIVISYNISYNISYRLNNRINHIHERALRIIYQDYNSSFKELPRKDSSLSIHQKNLELLVTEMFKVKIGCGPDITKEIFEIENGNYNFRHDFLIKRCNIRSVYYGTETAFIGPKIWDTLPNSCKDATSLKNFTVNLKRWIPENCLYRLCKTYIQRVGFL